MEKESTLYAVIAYTNNTEFILGVCATEEIAQELCDIYETQTDDLLESPMIDGKDAFDLLLENEEDGIENVQPICKTRIEEVLYYKDIKDIDNEN